MVWNEFPLRFKPRPLILYSLHPHTSFLPKINFHVLVLYYWSSSRRLVSFVRRAVLLVGGSIILIFYYYYIGRRLYHPPCCCYKLIINSCIFSTRRIVIQYKTQYLVLCQCINISIRIVSHKVLYMYNTILYYFGSY